MPGYVLDTTALITVFQGEPGADRVLAILDPAGDGGAGAKTPPGDPEPVYLPFMALMELEYLTRQRVSESEARRISSLVQAWPVEVIESNAPWRSEAARIKALFPLSLANAWISSLAMLYKAKLIHKDPEYDAVTGLESLQLPYKGRRKAREKEQG